MGSRSGLGTTREQQSTVTMPTNQEFVNAVFGADAPQCHVTDFTYDPNNIPKEQHLIAWKGDYFSRYTFQETSNQYFTTSVFHADENGVARRRKVLFKCTPCIVLDDVREKLSITQVAKLPAPSWILRTSPGSEQWGYILNTPCTDRATVENLLDGLVANGLAPEGRDPGMKGVTRYIRLPDGYNTKASKMVDGKPYKCEMLEWNPFITTTMEDLAAPFCVGLDAPRRESRVDGASNVPDHPLVNIPDIIKIKEVRSAGRYDITCPWVDEHTGADDSGTAVITNEDGSIGFKCHHGACQERTGNNLMLHIEGKKPGFSSELATWICMREFSQIASPPVSFMTPVEHVSFMNSTESYNDINQTAVGLRTDQSASSAEIPSPAMESTPTELETILNTLRTIIPGTKESRETAAIFLKVVDQLPAIEKQHWHVQVCDIMRWTKPDFKLILSGLREQWYSESSSNNSLYDDIIFIKEQNQFYSYKSRIFFTVEGFANSFMHEEAEVRKEALQMGRVVKVDKLDFAPKMPRLFEENNIVYGNTWVENAPPGMQSDVSNWLNHWDHMGWAEHRDHMLKWMAYTLSHPEKKINHILLLGGMEGTGKDFLLAPLVKAMGEYCKIIDGDVLMESFHDYIFGTKYLSINEAELGNRAEALAMSNKLKRLGAAPPHTLRVNIKGVKPIYVRNILNSSMTTNSQLPIRLGGPSRRIYATWSDLNVRGEDGNVTPHWQSYWASMWPWMDDQGGADACIWYLRNCVDLSGWNPAAAPPVTEFLKDIQEASKSPAQQTLEAFIKKRVGLFQSDILTSADMATVLRIGEMAAADLMYTEGRWFTPTRVGILLKEMPQCVQITARKNKVTTRVWVIRNVEKYVDLSPVELYMAHELQLQEARTGAGLRVV